LRLREAVGEVTLPAAPTAEAAQQAVNNVMVEAAALATLEPAIGAAELDVGIETAAAAGVVVVVVGKTSTFPIQASTQWDRFLQHEGPSQHLGTIRNG
jgi:hypothetical protein